MNKRYTGVNLIREQKKLIGQYNSELGLTSDEIRNFYDFEKGKKFIERVDVDLIDIPTENHDNMNLERKMALEIFFSLLEEKLSPRVMEVISKTYLDGKTQDEIANEYNVSNSRIGQIKKYGMNSIRSLLKNNEDFVEIKPLLEGLL